MSKNRYGRIYHSNHHHINLRFASVDARREYAEGFEKYHASHDHDGEAPRFEEIKASEAGSTTYESGKLHDAHSVTIDGYATYEIEEYHEDEKQTYYYRYKPPTCCVAPLISITRNLVRSDELERHELSAIFRDIPDEEYQSLLESVRKNGFIDNVIRVYEGQILDGWNRYRAAKELNLLRKLRFKQWHEDEHRDGDPTVFVYAKNMDRRHYDKATRAQIGVVFSKRFGHGGDRKSDESSHQNDDLKSQDEPKTREQLAKDLGMSVATIDRAIIIEKEGESEAVISGEKTAGEVLKTRTAKQAKKRKRKVLKDMWDKRKQAATDYVADGNPTDLNQYLSLDDLEKGFAKQYEFYAEAFTSGMKRIDRAHSFQDFQDRAFHVDEHGIAKVDISDLEEELKAISAYGYDILIWQRKDWSPDTNWILPMIETKKKKANAKVSGDLQAGVDEIKSEAAPETPEPTETDLKTLREQVKAQMSKYKEWYKASGYKESPLLSTASFSQFIHVFREYRETPQEGAATINELKDLLDTLKRKSYPFAHKLRQIVRPAQLKSDTAEAETSSLKEKIQQLRLEIREYLPTWKQDNPGTDNATFFQVLDARFRIEHGIQRGTGPFLKEELEELLALMKANDLGLVRKVREILGTGSGVNSTDGEDDRMKRCRSDLLEVWQQAYTWEGLEVNLYTEEYGIEASDIQTMQETIAAEHPKPETATEADHTFWKEVADAADPNSEVTSPTDAGCEIIDEIDEDTSLTELYNLPAVKSFLSSLYQQVGPVEHPATLDEFSTRVWNAITVDALDEDSQLTEREQLSILIDVALNLVAESL